MCLILFAVNPSHDTHLVVAANRDEQHARATLRANYWQDEPNILGGRDLFAGGTWLGVSKSGRFAAVTNFAEPPPEPLPPRSRGDLTADFLSSDISCQNYLDNVKTRGAEYRGFNLLISDGSEVYYYSNREQHARQLETGYYGLSNQLLDCDWPKVVSGRQQLEMELAQKATQTTNDLFELLNDRGDANPHTAKFILGDTYGTGASTVVIYRQGQIDFTEKGYAADGTEVSDKSFSVEIR